MSKKSITSKPLPTPPMSRVSRDTRRDSVNIDGVVGFTDLLGEEDKLILEGEKGVVTVAVAKWGFEARNKTEISLVPGAEVVVVDQHHSGWWTGKLDGKVGFFPANRTEPREIDLDEYRSEKRSMVQPMFPSGEAPALPDPMVKAGKILGISEQEAHALSPKAKGSSPRKAGDGPQPRDYRSQSEGGEFLTSPRKALNVMGFEEETRGQRAGSLARVGLKVSNGLKRFTGGTPERKGSFSSERKGSVSDRSDSPGGRRSPRSTRMSLLGSGNKSPRGGRSSSTAVPSGRTSYGDEQEPPREVKFAEESDVVNEPKVEKKLEFAEDDDWGKDDVDESNLIY